MKHEEIKRRIRRWLLFFLGGGINTAFTYGIYLAFNRIMGYQWAYLSAYALGISFAYWFNAAIVFKSALSWKIFFSYPLVYVIQYSISALLFSLLVEVAEITKTLAPLIVTVGLIPLTYLLNKRILRVNHDLTPG